MPNSPSLKSPLNSVTLSFWTNISQWDQSSAAFMGKSNTATLGQYGAIANNTPYIQFDLGGQYVRITRYFALNTWYFICLKYDGQKVKLYLNGEVYDSANFSGTLQTDNYPLLLGKHTPGAARYLKGKLDDIRIYNRALSDTEISRLYNEISLDIKIIPQGFFNPQNSNLRMKDTVRVYIRGSSSPYQIIDSSKAVIDSVTFTANVAAFVPPGSYYFEVKHRNSISVWSSSPVYLEGNVNYDFTASASQAYGNNLFFNGSVYCIYGGDVDRDGIIDASDVSSVDNGANSSAAGYIQTDITGDKFTDSSDVSIADNNARNLVSEFTPFTIQAPCNLTCDRFLNWSGFTWCVIGSNDTRCYPGPNYYSSNTDNVRVDSTGDLHIKITNRNGRFYCAEMHTVETVGYGVYTFAVSSRIDNLDKNVVLGLFTWNDKNCITNANSELDIEFTRWGDSGNPDVIEYSVQPTNSGQESDRFTSWPMTLTGNNSIHFIKWTPSLIEWSSHQGHTNPPPANNLIAYWSFNTNNTPKSSEVCNSDPVLIPAPEGNTHLNLNLWLNRGNYPSNNQEAEVIIHDINFVPSVLSSKPMLKD
ncbi:MAG: LamG-like jellyroll fold domain-containing protein [Ignavibacteria bacterium]